MGGRLSLSPSSTPSRRSSRARSIQRGLTLGFLFLKTLLASSTVGKAFVGVGLGRSWTVEQLLNELICKIEERDAALAQARRDRDRTLERLAKATHKLREEEKAGTK